MINTESISNCPACGYQGEIALEECRDRICKLPGNWYFRRCQYCSSLWLDPRPSRSSIPSLYPEQYTFTHKQPSSPLQEPQGGLKRLAFAAKSAILERQFGYLELSKRTQSGLSKHVGKLASMLPGFSRKAGYTVRFLGYRPEGKLLEVGVGNGNFSILMKELGWQVEGIEPDPQAAKIAQSSGVKVMEGAIEDVNLSASSYDAIVIHHVIEHIPDPKAVLAKLINSLKPGGILVSIAPNPVGMIAQIFGKNWYGLDAPRHLVLPSPRGYQHMLKKLDCKVNVSTSMQTAFWMFRASLRLQQNQRAGWYVDKVMPILFSWLSSLLLVFFPKRGEEVICIVNKN